MQKESEETEAVYSYMDRLSDMMDSDYKIDELIDQYLKHIADVKPITARQCIKLLPIIARDKPELKQALVYQDIQKALEEIQKL